MHADIRVNPIHRSPGLGVTNGGSWFHEDFLTRFVAAKLGIDAPQIPNGSDFAS